MSNEEKANLQLNLMSEMLILCQSLVTEFPDAESIQEAETIIEDSAERLERISSLKYESASEKIREVAMRLQMLIQSVSIVKGAI